MNTFEIKEHLGNGSYADVYRVVDGCKEFAMKQIHMKESSESRVKTEIEALKKLNHPNILSCIADFETENNYNIVMELCDGDLLEYINKNGKLCEIEARRIMKQLISAMTYAWKEGFCHRDIKLENIMMKNGNVLIGDWGFTAKINTVDDKFTDIVGSIPYECPQIISSKSYKGTSADIWSLGVVLYALVTGELPFEGKNNYKIKRNITKGNYFIPENISADLASLIASMLEVEENNRITIEDLQNHPWLNLKKKNSLRMEIPYINKSLEGLIDIFRAATISPRPSPRQPPNFA